MAKSIDEVASDDTERVHMMANCIEEFIEENIPEMGSDVYADLLRSAIWHIDFHEIAENILDE